MHIGSLGWPRPIWNSLVASTVNCRLCLPPHPLILTPHRLSSPLLKNCRIWSPTCILTNRSIENSGANPPRRRFFVITLLSLILSPNSKENWNDINKNVKSYMTTCSLVEHSKYKIRPIVEEYRHRCAMRRRASPSTSSTDNSSTSEEFPSLRAPSPKKERTATPSPINSLSHEQILRAMSIEIHQHADNSSFGSKERPIVVENTNEANTPPPPCTCCDKVGHQWEDCDASLKFRGICETCLWERWHGDCPHFQFPSPAFVKRTKMAVAK